jgi:hypothetical protein
MENQAFGKLWHLGLPRYLGPTSTFKWVGVIPIIDFPSGPRPCHLGLPSPVFWPNRKLRLIQKLSMLQPMPRTPFLEPSLISTYATCEYVKLRFEPSPTFRFTTQAHHKGYPMVVWTWAPTR